jgi:hypothetical protein
MLVAHRITVPGAPAAGNFTSRHAGNPGSEACRCLPCTANLPAAPLAPSPAITPRDDDAHSPGGRACTRLPLLPAPADRWSVAAAFKTGVKALPGPAGRPETPRRPAAETDGEVPAHPAIYRRTYPNPVPNGERHFYRLQPV